MPRSLSNNPRKLLALQQSSRRAYATKQLGDDNQPKAWVRTVTSGDTSWVRMVTFALDPVSVRPAVTVMDLSPAPSGALLYIVQEHFCLATMSEAAFMDELARVISGTSPAPYLHAEAVARVRLSRLRLSHLAMSRAG